MRQTNSYQTAVNGNPAVSAIASGNALAEALQLQQDKVSKDFLSRIIAGGGSQKDINNAFNSAAGNGVNPDVLAKMRGSTPELTAQEELMNKLKLDKMRADIGAANRSHTGAGNQKIPKTSYDFNEWKHFNPNGTQLDYLKYKKKVFDATTKPEAKSVFGKLLTGEQNNNNGKPIDFVPNGTNPLLPRYF